MRTLSLLILFLIAAISASAFSRRPTFDTFFVNRTLRIDYFHAGDARHETFALDRLWLQGTWAGSCRHLIDTLDLGRHYAKAYDYETNRLLLAKGYDSIFGEYQSTRQAREGVARTFHESVLMPAPKKPIRFVIESRRDDHTLEPVFETIIDPASFLIADEPLSEGVQVFSAHQSGPPHTTLDVAVLAEGYTQKEVALFKTDLARLTKVLLRHRPFSSRKNDISIRGVFKASQDSGVDEPSYGQYKNTTLDLTHYFLSSERYLMTENNRSLRDVAAHVPYDTIIILANQSRYGGGGIYNLYCTVAAHNEWFEYLLVHEFGHSFGGLADEYYTTLDGLEDFYSQRVEPRERNITALLDPKKLKWADLVHPGMKLPSPWEKDAYEAMDAPYQKERQALNEKIAAAMRDDPHSQTTQQLRKQADVEMKKHTQRVDAFLKKSHQAGKVGAFEGAGYTPKGLYRPMVDCIMFSRGDKPFCQVCQRSLDDMIDRYAQ
jgi:hypothetical protein